MFGATSVFKSRLLWVMYCHFKESFCLLSPSGHFCSGICSVHRVAQSKICIEVVNAVCIGILQSWGISQCLKDGHPVIRIVDVRHLFGAVVRVILIFALCTLL